MILTLTKLRYFCINHGDQTNCLQFEIIITGLGSSLWFIWIPMLWVHDHYSYFKYFNARIVFIPQQTRCIDTMLFWCWLAVVDVGPTWVNVSCLLGRQNLTSTDVRFRRIKVVLTLNELNDKMLYSTKTFGIQKKNRCSQMVQPPSALAAACSRQLFQVTPV